MVSIKKIKEIFSQEKFSLWTLLKCDLDEDFRNQNRAIQNKQRVNT